LISDTFQNLRQHFSGLNDHKPFDFLVKIKGLIQYNVGLALSLLFISQFPVCDWYELFKDNTFADACLDRLTGGAHRLEFLGESYRKKKNEKQKNEPAKAGETNRSELR